MARPKKEAITTDDRPGRDSILKEELPELPEKKKKMLFVSPHQKQGFKVPVRDLEGKTMTQTKPGTNMPVLINGRYVPVLRDCSFSTQSNNVKRGCLSYFETDNEDEIEVLLKLAEDPTNEIMTEETYLKKKDPVNYELKKELAQKDRKNQELFEENTNQRSIIADLEAQIEALTKPKG